MRIAITEVDSRSAGPCIAAARSLEQAGIDGFWIAGGWRDSLTLALLAGRDVPRVQVGTAVGSVWQTLPVPLAEQALTIHDAVNQRFVLGLGLSHFHMVEQRLGMKFEKPIRVLREFLTILGDCLEKRRVDFQGEIYSAHTDIRVPCVGRPKVVIAALGPQALRVTGELADGTLTFMVPLQALTTLTMPVAEGAARDVGRPRPYFAASVPVCVSNNVELAREGANTRFVDYGSGYYPSYRAALDRADTKRPGDVAIVGDEEAIVRELARYRDAGIDEVVGVPYGPAEDQARTVTLLAQLARTNALK